MRKRLSEIEIEHLVTQFNERTLPLEAWTHEAHLTVGLWFLSHYDLPDAVCRIRSGIIQFNHSVGTINDGQSGYHETMTVFWATVIFHYLQLNSEPALENIVGHFLESPLAFKTLPFLFYEKENLLSPAFRALFHAPSELPLDSETIKKILLKADPFT